MLSIHSKLVNHHEMMIDFPFMPPPSNADDQSSGTWLIRNVPRDLMMRMKVIAAMRQTSVNALLLYLARGYVEGWMKEMPRFVKREEVFGGEESVKQRRIVVPKRVPKKRLSSRQRGRT
jgi:hypothetical protein